MVLVHRAAAQLVPKVAVAAERAQRTGERAGEGRSVVGREREAVAVARVIVEVADGVREAADRAHHGDGPVAERDELPEPARLEARRHEEEIASRVAALRERRVEPEREEQPRRIAFAQLPPALLVRGVAAPEDDELSATLEQVGRDGGQEVDA